MHELPSSSPSFRPHPQWVTSAWKSTDKACFDLACMAAAASFFHELRHVQFFAQGDTPADGLEEKRQCDVFSREFLTAKVSEYCNSSGDDLLQTKSKRIVALSCAAFSIGMAESRGMANAVAGTHPPVADRFRHLVLKAHAPDDATCWHYLACLLVAILRKEHHPIRLFQVLVRAASRATLIRLG
ncbi:MAG: hypothetical protein JSS17_04340 [Proteobacteria bacterium]|nr:hypothetical protein [Pseudomonadota bacterium]